MMKMSRYGIEKSNYIREAPKKKRSFRRWLKNYINGNDFEITAEPMPAVSTDVFNKSFEGWQIRLHKANGGHIVEAWKNEDTGPTMNYRRPHELFFVSDSSDMGASINDILVQLMLRG